MQLFKILTPVLIIASIIVGSCSQSPPAPVSPKEPYFKPGEYGGNPIDSTEHLYNLQLSPDGKQMALIRAYTPGRPLEPRDQLWILNADGTDPELIGYNIGTVDWSPDGEKLAVTFMPGPPPYVLVYGRTGFDESPPVVGR